jgi:hypothetical protein
MSKQKKETGPVATGPKYPDKSAAFVPVGTGQVTTVIVDPDVQRNSYTRVVDGLTPTLEQKLDVAVDLLEELLNDKSGISWRGIDPPEMRALKADVKDLLRGVFGEGE